MRAIPAVASAAGFRDSVVRGSDSEAELSSAPALIARWRAPCIAAAIMRTAATRRTGGTMGRLNASFVANDQPEITLYVSGSFDATAAGRVCEEVRSLPTRWRVVIDFGQAREVSVLALGLLATTLSAAEVPRAAVRGLPRHLQRMVAYLGTPDIPREAA